MQRIAKGAGGKGPRQKASKIDKKCKDKFRHFSTFVVQGKSVRKSSKVSRHFSTIFARHQFSGPFCGPLINGRASVPGLPGNQRNRDVHKIRVHETLGRQPPLHRKSRCAPPCSTIAQGPTQELAIRAHCLRPLSQVMFTSLVFEIISSAFHAQKENLSGPVSQESPRQTKPKKGPKRKVHDFRPFL